MARKLTNVPELSLKSYTEGSDAERQEFEQALFEGFKYFGFIILKDHKVDHTLLQRAYSQSAAFFALPDDEKSAFIRPDGQRGYTPFGREHARDSKYPDLKEFWHVGREFEPDSPISTIYEPNLWPTRPDGFRETMLEIFNALENAGLAMLEALTASLDVPRDFFNDMTREGDSILRLLHYPPIPNEADPNSVRAAPHEDINLITLLVAANGGGLQLLDRDGAWLPIETDPENLIVDAGDMLARITNDVIPATTHRVVNGENSDVSRYSIPFFMHPHPTSILSCMKSCVGDGAKYPDITARRFLRQRLEDIGLVQVQR